MDSIIEYFQTIPSLHRTLILVSGLLFFWFLEGFIPFFKHKSRIKHASINLFFTLTTLIVNFGFAFVIIFISDWVSTSNIGLLQWIDWPIWSEILIGILVLDLIGAYTVHWLEHKIYWMWTFHVIHHSDEHVDTTTALRHHPGESVLRAIFTIVAIIIAGAPIWIVMIYQSVSAVMSQFNHANIRMNPIVEKMISTLLVTPKLHLVHHHHEKPFTDTNYGNIFSIWDRLFKTNSKLDTNDIVFGLDVYHKDPQNIKDLLSVPFDNERYTV